MVNERLDELIQRANDGDHHARNELFTAVYAQLHVLAERRMLEQRGDHTLQPTALVHEVFARMAGRDRRYRDAAHFARFAAAAMRSVLVDHARRRDKQLPRLSIDAVIDHFAVVHHDLLEFDDALRALEAHDAEMAALVELKLFGGCTAPEAANALGIPVRRVRSELRLGLAWLHERLDLG